MRWKDEKIKDWMDKLKKDKRMKKEWRKNEKMKDGMEE